MCSSASCRIYAVNQAQLYIPEVTNCSSRDSNIRARSTFFTERVVSAWNYLVYRVTLLVLLVSMLLNGVLLNMLVLVFSSSATSNFVYYCFSLGLVIGYC